MTTDEVIKAIALVGLGSILKGIFDFLASTRKAKQDAKQSTKETRYKAIILMCYAFVNYEREGTTLTINRPDISSLDRLSNEIQAEFINMSLYASDKVIISMKKFIEQKNTNSLNELAVSMRKDLYGIKTTLKGYHFQIK